MTLLVQFLLVVTGVAAVGGGIVLAVLGVRGAPDGFEDQDGFHVGRAPDAPAAQSVHPPREK